MESVRVEVDCSRLTGALESVLTKHGYRTLRSFDLPLGTTTNSMAECCACGELCPGDCNCRYAVLLAFPPQYTGKMVSISIQSKGDSSIVTLMALNSEGELVTQFAQLLIEALQSINLLWLRSEAPAANAGS